MGFKLDAWNVETVELTDADGDVGKVLHKPVTVGWRARRASVLAEMLDDTAVPEPPDKEAGPGDWVKWAADVRKANKSAGNTWAEFAREMLDDLVTGTRGIQDADGNEIGPAALLDYMSEAGPAESPAAPLVSLAAAVLGSAEQTDEGND